MWHQNKPSIMQSIATGKNILGTYFELDYVTWSPFTIQNCSLYRNPSGKFRHKFVINRIAYPSSNIYTQYTAHLCSSQFHLSHVISHSVYFILICYNDFVFALCKGHKIPMLREHKRQYKRIPRNHEIPDRKLEKEQPGIASIEKFMSSKSIQRIQSKSCYNLTIHDRKSRGVTTI